MGAPAAAGRPRPSPGTASVTSFWELLGSELQTLVCLFLDVSTEKKVGNQPTLSLLKTSSGRKGDRKRSGSGRRPPWKQRGAKPGEEPASGSPSLMSRGATRPVLSFCRSRVCMRVRVYEVPAACQRSHCGASLPQTALGVYLLPHPTVYIVNKLGL